MRFLEKLRKRRDARRREHAEKEAEELAAEQREEAEELWERKDAVSDERLENDFPSRGGGYIGR
ncbi:MAG TPA: hypothetical protein VLU96_04510 [Gaiellaceae bacterium]|nr:hypothetical protein [Gaiellaceae bacterium]